MLCSSLQGTPDYMHGMPKEPFYPGQYGDDWREEMETRLARISQDVKTTRSDIAEVLYYLKNQPALLVAQSKQDGLNSVLNPPVTSPTPNVGHMSGSDIHAPGKSIQVITAASLNPHAHAPLFLS